eukprot:2768132-Pyramimonas_sp.AAC.2
MWPPKEPAIRTLAAKLTVPSSPRLEPWQCHQRAQVRVFVLVCVDGMHVYIRGCYTWCEKFTQTHTNSQSTHNSPVAGVLGPRAPAGPLESPHSGRQSQKGREAAVM